MNIFVNLTDIIIWGLIALVGIMLLVLYLGSRISNWWSKLWKKKKKE